MANRETNNFKQALNELLAGKITTDEPEVSATNKASDEAAKNEAAEAVREIENNIFREMDSALNSEDTVIGKSVVIEGNVRTTSRLVINGEVTGSVISTADLVITGKVGGAIQGNNITLSQCEINDTVTASNEVLISPQSVINGDIKSGSLTSEGAINGNVNANTVTLLGTSKTVGDISCKTIRINEGASLKGKLETV
ncbi:MAG: polymer-forming cytoskeletal protein [Ruminococcaceae bacterium]|nr:polymer-forming cytoskeletal protein [Oscillospiraceae bacterium]